MAKESNLTINTTMDESDYVRVVIGGSSRRITLDNLISASEDAIYDLGFQKNTAVNRSVTTVTSNYVATVADSIILVDASSNDVIITLPTMLTMWDAADSVTKVITIKKIDQSTTYNVTINPDDGENIDNTNNVILSGSDEPSVTVLVDGTNYWTM